MVKKLEDMSVKELRVEAKAQGFKKVSKLGKPALLEALGHRVVESTTPPPSPITITVKPTDFVPPKQTRTRRAPTKETVGAIESGVPIPVAPAKAKYPLEALKSGETFLVTCPAKDAKKIRLNIMNAARRITKKTGAAFLVLVWEQEKGVRCWRMDYDEAREPEISTLGATASEVNSQEPEEKSIEFTDEVVQEPQGEVVEQLTQEPLPDALTDEIKELAPPPIVAPTPFKLFND